jgi:signal transduction histidine kinase
MSKREDLTMPLRVLGPGGTLAADQSAAASGIGPHRRRSRLRTLTARAIVTTSAAALTSVLITALVAFPLAIRAANSEARQGLIGKTEIVADLVGPRIASGLPADEERVVLRLRRQGVDVYLVRDGVALPGGLPPRVVDKVATTTGEVSDRGVVGGKLSLIEGRGMGNGNGVVLVQRAATGTAKAVWGRLWLSLLLGLAGGIVAGTLLARRLARPFRNAATAAARLTAGDRRVVLPIEPPAEAEDLANALNNLTGALATSEGRQRDFLLSVSHELRTPLTSIKGYAEAIADGVVGADGTQKVAQTMLHEAEHLDRLVADLLALARLEAADFPVEMAPVDLTALIGGAADAWAGRCSAVGLELHAELPAAPIPAYTDPGRIRQVVDGLLENALRVVPPGAPLVLAARPGAAPGYLGADGHPVSFAVVEVRDGGPGFTDEDLAVAFERGALYQRYRGVRKVGSGLGLALAARLVRRLGGHIEAGHAREGGARFTVRLPVTPYELRTSR